MSLTGLDRLIFMAVRTDSGLFKGCIQEDVEAVGTASFATGNDTESIGIFRRLLGRYWQSKPRCWQWRHLGNPPLHLDFDARQGRQALSPRRRSIPPMVYLVRCLKFVACPWPRGILLPISPAKSFCACEKRQLKFSLLQFEQPLISPSQRT
jgi:hypothetical protein